jgi:hypothetical protein
LCAQCRHDPAPPWKSTSTGPSPHNRHTILPSPHGVSVRVAARSSRSRNAAGPWSIRSFILFPFADIRGRLGTPPRHRQGQAHSLRNVTPHDDCFYRRRSPAMAVCRARARIAPSAAPCGHPARRPAMRSAVGRTGRATTGSRNRRALDLRQPRQRRRPGDVGQPGRTATQPAHQTRRAARQGCRDRRRTHCRPGRYIPSTHLGTAGVATPASPRAIAGRPGKSWPRMAQGTHRRAVIPPAMPHWTHWRVPWAPA